jgi:hypothetical protein
MKNKTFYTITDYNNICLVVINEEPKIEVVKLSNRSYLVKLYKSIKEQPWEK